MSAANCSEIKERRGLPLDVRRMMGLTTASELLGGQRALAEALSIEPRALRYKLNAERGVSDCDVLLTATALDQLAARASDIAARLRAMVP